MATVAAKPAPSASTASRPPSRLAKATKGRLIQPNRFVIYGPEGVGKTSLAADAPNPIMFDIEDGSTRIDVTRYPFHDGPSGHVPRTFADVLLAIDDLATSEHDFKTLIIDTADKLESLLWIHMTTRDSAVSARNPKGESYGSIIDYGWGKGFEVAVEEWRSLCSRLDRLRFAKQMDVILVAHAQIKLFKSPETEDFDRYQLKLNDKAGNFLKEWADATGFFSFEETTKGGSKTSRAKGVSTGTRLLRFSRSSAFDAKSRISLPSEIVIPVESPWAPVAEAVRTGFEVESKKIEAQIFEETRRIGDEELTAKVGVAVASAMAKNDMAALLSYLNALKIRPIKSDQS
jgi:hypothetical protein